MDGTRHRNNAPRMVGMGNARLRLVGDVVSRRDDIATLRQIGVHDLKLSPQTLYQVRKRYADDFPEADVIGPDGTAYYNRAAMKAWYIRSIESLPTYNRAGGRAAG